MLPTERFTYSPIVGRPRLRLPGDIMGAPHRLRYFSETLAHIQSRSGVLFWTGEQILDWYRAAQSGAAVEST
jgi:hypothetical protein